MKQGAGALLPLRLDQAQRAYRCRICGGKIRIDGCVSGWQSKFGSMIHPMELTLNFGEEFAHTDCLDGKV